MSAQAWVATFGGLLFLAALAFVFPHWDSQRAEQGEAVAENIVRWWRAYRSYRRVVSDEYSRHDGTQRKRSERRYYSKPNPAEPVIPNVIINPWFSHPIEIPVRQGRHLAEAA